MRAFLLDYWWLMLGLLLGATLAIVNRRSARKQLGGTLPTVSFAAIRAYSVLELQPFFGVYVPTWREYLGYAVLAAWFAGLAAVVAYSSEVAPFIVGLAAGGAAIPAAAAAFLDAHSRRVLGPDHISFISPVRILSWSVPLSDVLQCDLVPGRPYNRLRVVTRHRTRSLPLPQHLWESLRSGSSN